VIFNFCLEGTVSRSASITIPDIVLLVRISSEIAEVMNLLEVRLFRLPADFLSTLSEVRMQAVGPAAPTLHAAEDPFAPGMELTS
jgi:hypothetical protein